LITFVVKQSDGSFVPIAHTLLAAIAARNIAAAVDIETLAEFIIVGLQGAILLAKVQLSTVPIVRFEHILFGMVLGQSTPTVCAPREFAADQADAG